jgi:hypothetical protein
MNSGQIQEQEIGYGMILFVCFFSLFVSMVLIIILLFFIKYFKQNLNEFNNTEPDYFNEEKQLESNLHYRLFKILEMHFNELYFLIDLIILFLIELDFSFNPFRIRTLFRLFLNRSALLLYRFRFLMINLLSHI